MWCMNEYKKSLTILTTNIVVDIVVGLVNGGSFIIVCGVLFFFFLVRVFVFVVVVI